MHLSDHSAPDKNPFRSLSFSPRGRTEDTERVSASIATHRRRPSARRTAPSGRRSSGAIRAHRGSLNGFDGFSDGVSGGALPLLPSSQRRAERQIFHGVGGIHRPMCLRQVGPLPNFVLFFSASVSAVTGSFCPLFYSPRTK